ncbi:FAD binding domain protein [Seminavis robusta]|uniref:FAD binding domain protein n=1 Tax=Seminavis robusta TaxID=568900 RepID=A0A9N8E7W6_9STRA|nr:FAD binding domain protein [Seminavis robusta]|eukprot:Sro718_g192130.1 FAD binding domain protein (484) ;mRNA; r:4456-5984
MRKSKSYPPKTIQEFDVCIIGAGPAGLAALSAIQEPYSLDNLTPDQLHRAAIHLPECTGRSVAVVDAHPQWMQGWTQNFAALDIQFLRSPTMAHPDLFDKNALLAFAEVHGRQDELIESGCGDLQSLIPLGESQIGLWKLPSTALFRDFCQDLSRRLKHTYVRGHVSNIAKEAQGPLLEVSLAGGGLVRAGAVILAQGQVGTPIVPRALAEAPRVIPWTALGNDETSKMLSCCQHVLVVGGGLTAVQAAQRIVRGDNNSNTKVTLCSRRPLIERHFDLSLDWFDRRTANKCMSDFYHHPNPLSLLKTSRDGGSVPGIYMKELLQMEQTGRLVRLVGNARYVGKAEQGDRMKMVFAGDGDTATRTCKEEYFDVIVLACGIQPDCESNALCQKLLQQWPVDVCGGFPSVTEDLEWVGGSNVYVLGGLGSLNIGPDAANLMGMRRGAQLIANALECRCWLRTTNVLKNRFDAFMEDTSDSEEEEED